MISQIYNELHRRRVFHTAALYIVGAWAALQVAELAFPGLDIPDYAIRHVWIGAFFLFPLVLFFGWRYDVNTAGIRLTPRAGAPNADTSLKLSDYWIIGSLSFLAVAIITVMVTQIVNVEADVAIVAPENTIAVMPFTVCEGKGTDEVLARSITSEVINRLASRDRLKVIGRVSSIALAGFGLSSSQIATPLRVHYVLSGILCDDGVKSTLEVELSDADGYVVWSDRFEQQVNEFDQITLRLATSTANAVAAELGEVPVPLHDTPVQRLAYQQMLLGRQHRWDGNLAEARAAIEKALQHQRDYAEGVFELAALEGRLNLASLDVMNVGTRIEDAWPTAVRALSLAVDEIERGASSFRPYFVAGKTERILAEWQNSMLWRKSNELDQTDLDALNQSISDRYANAEKHLRTAMTLNPSEAGVYWNLGLVIAWFKTTGGWFEDAYLFHMGRGKEVVERKKALVDSMSDEEILEAHTAKATELTIMVWEGGDRNRAIRLMESIQHATTSMPETDTHGTLYLALWYMAVGRDEEARPLFERAVRQLETEYDYGGRNPGTLHTLASAYVAMGRDEEGLEMLRKAVDYNFLGSAFRRENDVSPEENDNVDPWNRLKDDPRYLAQLSRMRAVVDSQRERIRAMLAEHDIDDLLAPLTAMVREESVDSR